MPIWGESLFKLFIYWATNPWHQVKNSQQVSQKTDVSNVRKSGTGDKVSRHRMPWGTLRTLGTLPLTCLGIWIFGYLTNWALRLHINDKLTFSSYNDWITPNTHIFYYLNISLYTDPLIFEYFDVLFFAPSTLWPSYVCMFECSDSLISGQHLPRYWMGWCHKHVLSETRIATGLFFINDKEWLFLASISKIWSDHHRGYSFFILVSTNDQKRFLWQLIWFTITSKITFDELATHSGSRVSCWRPRTSCSPHGPLENKRHQTVWNRFHKNCQNVRPGAQLVTASLNVWQVVTSAGNVFWLLAIPQRNFRARRLEYLRITFLLLLFCVYWIVEGARRANIGKAFRLHTWPEERIVVLRRRIVSCF